MVEIRGFLLLNQLLENADIVGLADLDCDVYKREAVDREKLRRIDGQYIL